MTMPLNRRGLAIAGGLVLAGVSRWPAARAFPISTR